MRHEVAELRASRERLALAADADRRRIERDLHAGVHQHLLALAVNLQLADLLTETDAPRAKALIGEMERDVQEALDDAARLARRIYPPLLEAGGLAAALRSVAPGARIEVAGDGGCPAEIASAVYFCVLEALAHVGSETAAEVAVRGEGGALAFDVVGDGARPVPAEPALDRLRDRVEALGGRLTFESEPGGARVSGSIPCAR